MLSACSAFKSLQLGVCLHHCANAQWPHVCAQPVRRLLEDEFPKLRYIETSTLHRAVPSAHHTFVPMSGVDNKLDRLAQVSAQHNPFPHALD